MSPLLDNVKGMNATLKKSLLEIENLYKSGRLSQSQALSRITALFSDGNIIQAQRNGSGIVHIFYTGEVFKHTYWDDVLKTNITQIVYGHDVAKNMISNNSGYVMLGNCKAGNVLNSLNFKNYIQTTFGLSKSQQIAFFNDTDNGLWRAVSENMAKNVKGDIITITPYAKSNSVFYKTELYQLINNNKVNTINGMSREIYQNCYNNWASTHGADFALGKTNSLMSAASAINNFSNPNIDMKLKDGSLVKAYDLLKDPVDGATRCRVFEDAMKTYKAESDRLMSTTGKALSDIGKELRFMSRPP